MDRKYIKLMIVCTICLMLITALVLVVQALVN